MEGSLDKLAAALVGFQSEVPTIAKTQTAKVAMKNGGTYSYTYADLGDIWDAIRPVLAKHELAVTQFLLTDEEANYLETTIWHSSGQKFGERFELPLNGKTPQEAGSVVTYFKRYTLGAALGISTEEDDDGKAGNKAPVKKTLAPATKTGLTLKQTDELRELGRKASVDLKLVEKSITNIQEGKATYTAVRDRLLAKLFDKDAADNTAEYGDGYEPEAHDPINVEGA